MSTQVNQYIMHGLLVDYDLFCKYYYGDGFDDSYHANVEPYSDSAFDSKIKVHNGLSMIFDGMSGSYVYIGRIEHKSDNWRPFDFEYEFNEMDLDKKDLIYNLILSKFPKLKDHYEVDNIKTHLVSHYR